MARVEVQVVHKILVARHNLGRTHLFGIQRQKIRTSLFPHH